MVAMIRTSSSMLDREKLAWKLFEAIWEDDFLGLEAIFVLGAMVGKVFMKLKVEEDERFWSWRTGELSVWREKDLEDFWEFEVNERNVRERKGSYTRIRKGKRRKRKWIRVLSE